MKTFLSFFIFLLSFTFTYSQNLVPNAHRGCPSLIPDSDEAHERVHECSESILNRQARVSTQTFGAETVFKIRVVVHVLYNTATQNISDAQIASQIDILNKDFRRSNADTTDTPAAYASITGDSRIEFELDSTIRIPTTRSQWDVITPSFTVGADYDKMKSTSEGGSDPFNTSQYLNIWVCEMSNGLLGYAQFPAVYGFSPNTASTDGVVVDHRYFGSNGTATFPYNEGRTATHEVGHWLGLFHIWGDGNCSVDDGISDTPLCSGSSSSDLAGITCIGPGDQCGAGDRMIENYMDYSIDRCMNLFTNGQISLMRAILEQHRSGVYTVEPTVSFSIDHDKAVVNDPIVYTNNSASIDSLYWEFEGGTPASSKVNQPTVQYGTAGTYKTKLTVYYSGGISESLEIEDIIEVSNTLEARIGVSDSVLAPNQTLTLYNNSVGTDSIFWFVNNVTQSRDDTTSLSFSSTGSNEIKLVAYSLTGGTNDTVTKTINVFEPLTSLSISASSTTIESGDSVTFINTSPVSDSVFWEFEGGNVDTSYSDTVNVVYNSTGMFDVFIKIFGEAQDSLYATFADYIEVESFIPSDDNAENSDLLVYPNPSPDNVFNIYLKNDKISEVQLVDFQGHELVDIDFGETPEGQIQFDLSLLGNGVYLLRVVGDNGVSTKRIIKQ